MLNCVVINRFPQDRDRFLKNSNGDDRGQTSDGFQLNNLPLLLPPSGTACLPPALPPGNSRLATVTLASIEQSVSPLRQPGVLFLGRELPDLDCGHFNDDRLHRRTPDLQGLHPGTDHHPQGGRTQIGLAALFGASQSRHIPGFKCLLHFKFSLPKSRPIRVGKNAATRIQSPR